MSLELRTERPLYTMAEAAQIVDVPASTMRSWVKGYRRESRNGRPVIGEPFITSFGTRSRGMPSIPFIGTAEALVVAAVRRRGVPLQRGVGRTHSCERTAEAAPLGSALGGRPVEPGQRCRRLPR